jgi:hypothetical protein
MYAVVSARLATQHKMLGSTLATVRKATGNNTFSCRPAAPPAENARSITTPTLHALSTHGTARVNMSMSRRLASYIRNLGVLSIKKLFVSIWRRLTREFML